MSKRPTPETEEAIERWRQGKINIFDDMSRIERERDGAREERDIARLEFEEISNDLKDSRNRIWQLENQIEGLNNFANERYEEIQSVRKERDEARELCRVLSHAANEMGYWWPEEVRKKWDSIFPAMVAAK